MTGFRRKEKKPTLIIVRAGNCSSYMPFPVSLTSCSQSAPFDFKKENTYLPGITDSE